MAIDLDLVIDSGEDQSVDMKSGLESMQGVSDAIRCISETVLSEKVPHRKSSKSKVRTKLKKSFKGSYGQIFSLEVYDPDLQKKLRSITRPVFIELIAYFFSESLYKESNPLTERAKKILDGLGKESEDLVTELRKSMLENIHEVSTKFNHDIKIRYRQNRDVQTVIAKFDRETVKVLNASTSKEEFEIEASITRLNRHTGNGRLQLKGANETVAFGFSNYKKVEIVMKKPLSKNLDYNNGINEDKWRYLKLKVSPIKLKDGKIIKYIIKAIHES